MLIENGVISDGNLHKGYVQERYTGCICKTYIKAYKDIQTDIKNIKKSIDLLEDHLIEDLNGIIKDYLIHPNINLTRCKEIKGPRPWYFSTRVIQSVLSIVIGCGIGEIILKKIIYPKKI